MTSKKSVKKKFVKKKFVKKKKKSVKKKSVKKKSSTFFNKIFDKMMTMNLDKIKFVNFTTSGKSLNLKVKFNLKSRLPNFRSYPTWKDILCREQKLSMFTIKTICNHPQGGAYPKDQRNKMYKVFVKGYQTFYDYILDIQNGTISRSKNKSLWKKLLNILTRLRKKNKNIQIINHNTDVNTLHFKFE